PMTITTGIMTFTPDGQPCCGKSAEIEGLYHCAGFCGHGIVQSPSIGVVMAELIVDGRSRYDIAQLEADRFFEIPQLHERREVKRQARETYAGYYGKVVVAETN
ncbi:MAG: FAD-binding oxidoreductase, partial [Planctomycetaceae bacterium]|nr:FAD-binding oxidoreductase [Planctomycetaceae bacterium]